MSAGRLASLAALLSLAPGPAEASLDQALQALRQGRYEEAIEAFEKESVALPTPKLYKGWVEALRLTGDYEGALTVIDRFLSREPASVELATRRGEILYATGREDEARAEFEKAIRGGAADRLRAELNLAVLLYEHGDLDDAVARFDRFIDVYNGSSRLSGEDLEAVGTACRYLGVTNHDLYRDALRAYDEAKAKSPESVEPTLRAGELFLEKYNSPDATESFQAVLQQNPNHPEALLGLARARDFDGSSEAVELARKALEVNPRYVAARAFVAEQLVGLEDFEGAREEAKKALEVNPVSSDALPILAAAVFLSGDRTSFREIEAKVLARNPKDAGFYNQLSIIAVNNRLYREARDFAQKAVDLDPRSFEGYGLLGLNQLRLGDIEAGRKNLERSFEGDPYNVWIKNTLDLLDTYADFETTKTPRFEIFVERKESDLLATYVERIADEAYEKLSERYEFRPETPIRIEVYPSHGDFSVRTLGLPGLGALGVCFGPVIAVDSPSARPKGQFNWASTLWHELAHTVTLGATDHEVPRWFSEGLSVLEERRARTGWGDDASISFLAAYQRGKLLPLAELNNGFMRPTYPQQITVSYYQASLVSELIERDFGFAAIRGLLAAYREGLDTEEAFRKVVNLSLSEFDSRFDAYLKERFETVAASLRLPPERKDDAEGPSELQAVTVEELETRAERDEFDFIAQLETGRKALADGDKDKALRRLSRAKELFPGYWETGSPYPLLASIYEERGDLAKAASELRSFVDINESDYDAHVKLFELYRKLGKTEDAATVLERAIYIYPFDAQAHRNLADAYRTLGRTKDVVVEKRALLALTNDRAQGLYELALAYYEAGDIKSARREVLRALEIAPGFKEGLSLLLKVSRGSGGGGA
jgi:tetratricopeptide (TPR) repeat protein